MAQQRATGNGDEGRSDPRERLCRAWLTEVMPDARLLPACQDASVRRYFRARGPAGSWVLMDAPPDKLDCRPFVAMAERLQAMGLRVPAILARDLEQGLLLLEDLGTETYWHVLDAGNAGRLYDQALDALLRMQLTRVESGALPPYDRQLLEFELEIFVEWYLGAHRHRPPSAPERRVLDDLFEALVGNALDQPRVFVHRDFHSRNLMPLSHDGPGVLDFQDAVWGPLTYDLVSLLRDCYVTWPQGRVGTWIETHRQRLVAAGVAAAEDAQRFQRWFDLMGLQRHLKAVGIFARLQHRDGRASHVPDIPRTYDYILAVSGRYPELAAAHPLLRAWAPEAR